MSGRHPLNLTLLVLGGVVVAALLIASANALWRYVEEHDANPSRDGLKEQMMQR